MLKENIKWLPRQKKKHERRLEILRSTQRSKENIQQLSLQFQIINSMCLIQFIFEEFPD